MPALTEVLDNIGGAIAIGGLIVTRPLVKARYNRWHVTDAELAAKLPGDARVPNPQVVQMLGVTIKAQAAAIWPWISQIGQERGGLYSYELLENLARCQMRNADRIVPEWELKVGDRVRLGPEGYPVHQVVGLERGRWLLLAGANLKTGIADPLPQPGQAQYANFSWVLYLDERRDGATRLLSRTRLAYAPRTFGARVMWEWMTDPIGFVMTRKMLLGIKERVEG
jgi:hypothetical protein